MGFELEFSCFVGLPYFAGTDKASCDGFALDDFVVAGAMAGHSHGWGNKRRWVISFPCATSGQYEHWDNKGPSLACLEEIAIGGLRPFPVLLPLSPQKRVQSGQCCHGGTQGASPKVGQCRGLRQKLYSILRGSQWAGG